MVAYRPSGRHHIQVGALQAEPETGPDLPALVAGPGLGHDHDRVPRGEHEGAVMVSGFACTNLGQYFSEEIMVLVGWAYLLLDVMGFE